ncbi:MAG: glycosyltransferase family 2 protein, partial [Thermoguttaceae bacterium]
MMPPENKIVLSILMPVYNEEKYLDKIVKRVLSAPTPNDLPKELIIVNDCSTDTTAEVIRKLCEEHKEIRAFEQARNMGKGAAIRRAVDEMSGTFAIIQDADLEYDPKDYMIVLQPLVDGLADVVYGSRFATREMRRIVHYHHKLANSFLTHLSNVFTGLDLTDMETCYKAFKGELLKSIPIRSNRFGIEPELTAKVARRKVVVYEVPIS